MSTFADYYSLPQFQAQQDHAAKFPFQDSKDWDSKSEALEIWHKADAVHDKVVELALTNFLNSLRMERALVPVPAMFKRGHRLAHSWNAFVARTEKPHEMERLCSTLSYAMLSLCKVRKVEDVEGAYRRIVGDVDNGNFPWFFTDSSEECQTTGERLHMEWQGWVPRMGTMPPRDRCRDSLTPARAIEPAKVIQHEILAPSGEMLIADWFRIPAFTEAVADPAAKAYEYSINNAAGLQRQAQWYCEVHGFASIFVGNTSPQILVRDGTEAERNGQVLLAHLGQDTSAGADVAGVREVGTVCTDLWWTTIIDREVLTSIVARSMTRGDAEKAVADLIEEWGIKSVRVRPGRLYVYHTAEYSEMGDFVSAAVATKGLDTLFCVISEQEIAFDRKAAS